jgi:two-component system CheB/CheR fusion protein
MKIKILTMVKKDMDTSITESLTEANESAFTRTDFPVVCIGASAGGLEALQEFFQNMPPNPGAAFVIIQHLSPDYKSLMDELLARYTPLKIHRVEDGMPVEKDHLYLIPPRKNMTIFHGKLLLSDQNPGRSLNLPIDIFMRSLAKDQEKNAIGIILSGTGSDGTLGIRAIKEYGGMTMVQDDRSAKFDGMPRSSISTGKVDIIRSASQLPLELFNYINHPLISKSEKIEQQISEDGNQLSKMISILRDEMGVDFSCYKDSTIIRRLEKRISINRFATIEDYVNFLSGNQREVHVLFNDLLIGVTRFFRDEEAFEKIKNEVLPVILKPNVTGIPLRIWSSGCSTGEEPYSLAMMIKEYLNENFINREVKIFATDIDSDALDFAGSGTYPESIISDVSPERLSRFFTRKDGGYQITDNIRSMVIFAKHNILRDPPFSKIDLISCRNMLIYLNADVQQKILSMFYMSLKENSFMFLGSSESIGGLSDGFFTIDTKHKIYKQKPGFRPAMMESFSVSPIQNKRNELKSVGSYVSRSKIKISRIDSIFDELLGEYVPPSVIIDDSYEIIHTIHNVGGFISLPIGQISLNLLKMLPKELSVLVSSLLRKASNSDQIVVFENILLPKFPEKTIDVSGRRLTDNKTGERYFIISFLEKDSAVKKPKSKARIGRIDVNNQYQDRIAELERELQFKSESLQATVEELETSNEELQSSNEELIASNEELQSTNEELQSVNEELYTVNAEHQNKIEELTELNADMDNLLKNTRIGTLFLDRSLTIRKINDVAARLTNIRITDIGRPIHHLSFDNLYSDFMNDLQNVLETLQSKETEVHDKNKDCYLVRIIPYRTAEYAVDGIIVTFIDINTLKKSEVKIGQLNNRLEMSMNLGGLSWWEWDYAKNILKTGNLKSSMLGFTPEEIGTGYEAWSALVHPDDLESKTKAMHEHLQGNTSMYETEYRIRMKTGGFLWFMDRGGVSQWDKSGKPVSISGIVMDITHHKETDLALQDSEMKYSRLFHTMVQGVVYQNSDGFIVTANPAAQQILGLSLEQMQGRQSIDPEWKAIHTDGTLFPGDEHPAMQALKTGKDVHDVIMGVYNPLKKINTWININAIPLFREGESKPYLVYATFEDITVKIKSLAHL